MREPETGISGRQDSHVFFVSNSQQFTKPTLFLGVCIAKIYCNMKAIRATFVFVLLISFLTIPLKSIAQDCNGEYNITATFDANDNKVQTDYGLKLAMAKANVFVKPNEQS